MLKYIYFTKYRGTEHATDVKNLFISGQTGILMQDWVCSTLFSVQKVTFIFLFPPPNISDSDS